MTYHPGKIALLAAVLSIVASAVLLSNATGPADTSDSGAGMGDAIKRLAVDKRAQARITRLLPVLAFLAKRPQETVGKQKSAAVNLALLGFRKLVPPAQRVAPPVPAPIKKAPVYNVSMTYVSNNRRFAVINSRFYHEGGMLPDGERVVSISPSAVRIERDGNIRTLAIKREGDGLKKKGGRIKVDSTTELGRTTHSTGHPQPVEPSAS